MDAVGIVNALYDALNAKDIDALMMFFADNAVIVDGSTVYKGKDQIHSIVEYSVQHDDWVEASDIQVSGNTATWIVHVRQGDNKFDLKIEAVIENDKFISFTFL